MPLCPIKQWSSGRDLRRNPSRLPSHLVNGLMAFLLLGGRGAFLLLIEHWSFLLLDGRESFVLMDGHGKFLLVRVYHFSLRLHGVMS